ncbi:MAG: DotI/IcmL/TraM family protein [Bdellovibrionales bacterium]
MTLKRNAVETIVNRNEFYQDGYRMLLKLALVQGFLIVVLAGSLLAIFLMEKPIYRFFATTSDGRIIDIVPLDNPYRGDVVAWSSQAATEAMTFAFTDYRLRLQNSSKFFTQRGWQTFIEALNKARVLEAVDKRQLNVKGTPNAAPQIKRQGVVNGVYQWVLEMPYTIEYLGSGEIPQPTSGTLTLVVQRVPNLENPQGIGIDQWIMVSK